MNPGTSFLTTTTVLPKDFARSTAAWSVASLVVSARMTSTSGISIGGLKKCIPTTFFGRFVTEAMSVIGNADVFDARIVFGGAAHLSRADDRDPQFLRRSFRWMGQTALKMWCVPLRKRLCAVGVMENRDRRGPLARIDHHRRDHRGGPRPLPRRPGAPRTTRVQSPERARPWDRLDVVPRHRPRPGRSRRVRLLDHESGRMAPRS